MRAFFIALLIYSLLPLSAVAAVVPTFYELLEIEATPVAPGPGQSVTLRAHSLAEKGEYNYIWTVNGSVVLEGVDADTARINTGELGSTTNVLLRIEDAAGATAGEASYVLRPADIDIVWEGRTYVPPFYRGLPYPDGESGITITAYPHFMRNGKEVPRDEVVYVWSADGKSLDGQSGYGRSSLVVPTARFKDATAVTVTAETRDGVFTAKKSVSIPTVTPRLIVYEEKPLSGVLFNRATPASTDIVGDEITFRAFPFFAADPAALKFAWTLNGAPFELSNAKAGEATFRKQGKGSGKFSVVVQAVKPNSLFERMSTAFTLKIP